MTIDLDDGEFHISDPGSLWAGESLYNLYGKAYTPWDWHKPIFEHAQALGMIPFSTPFDKSSVEFLESLDVSCYKIASFENTDLPLIRMVAATGKPLIISTGMASIAELDETVRAAREAGCRDSCCWNVRARILPRRKRRTLRRYLTCAIYSTAKWACPTHTMGVGVSVAAVALGATVIEKHFTLRRADGGVDSAFSMEPDEFAQLVIESRRAWEARGVIRYGPTDAERKSLAYRRSLYIVTDLPAGATLTNENVRAIRPGLGLAPKYLDAVIGRTVKREVRRGTALSWNLLE